MPEYEELLNNLFIQKVVKLSLKVEEETHEVVLVYVPFPCLSVMRSVHNKLVPELEKHLSCPVVMTAARKI